MGARRSGALTRRPRLAALLVLGAAGLAAWAACTTPFTDPADTVTAVGIAAMAAAVARTWRPRRKAAALGAPSRGATDGAQEGRTPGWWPWALLAAAVVAWELLSFFSSPRIAHPTISSLYDSATTVRAVKGLLFAAWLALGAALLRR